jgi:3-hydroxyisobutyrate dehydrogenase-like beta-hydroxyacid dehydrogenase
VKFPDVSRSFLGYADGMNLAGHNVALYNRTRDKAEALQAAVAPQKFLDVMNALFAPPVVANYGRTIAEEQFEPAGFALRWSSRTRLLLAAPLNAPRRCPWAT